MLKKILALTGPIFLASCIGSGFVVDDADTSASFPDLHDVPERPVLKKRSKEQAFEKEKLSESKEQELKDNESLRNKYKL